MYTTYFGLREMPFSITPDPAYLYMSPRHQEALGHLLYGTGQFGGFVQLTGEVGTGKTTVVRALLAQKLEHVDVAVILNPRQNEQEFVASLCDELHVKYPKKPTLKALVDALNDPMFTVRLTAQRALSTFGAAAEKDLLAALPASQAPARRAVVQLLGELQSRRAYRPLKALENDPDPWVRDDVREALGGIRPSLLDRLF